MIWDYIVKFAVGDLSAEEKKGGFLIMWRAGFMVFIAFSFNWLDFMGIPGFARDLRIDNKNAAQMIAYNTGRIDAFLADWRDSNTRLLRLTLVDLQVKQCHAPKEETKAIYREEIEEAQQRYWHFTRTYFDLPSCANL